MEEENEGAQYQENKVEDQPPPRRRRVKKLFIPRRTPSTALPPRTPVYTSPDMTTCAQCPCYPAEEPYEKKKLHPCLKSPRTLYELAGEVVDSMNYPDAFNWTEEEVATWIADAVGLPQYRECVLANNINGRRLLMLEEPSRMPPLNIHHHEHIKMITLAVRNLYNTACIVFARSVGLPPRKPLTHCTWFKSRTGPSWGIRQNWTRSDILRWMKMLMPQPLYMDHWDMVWYKKPDFPRVTLARIQKHESQMVPHYKPPEKEICKEYLALRKFRLQTTIPESAQMIWMEHRPGSPIPSERQLLRMARRQEMQKRRHQPVVAKETRLEMKKVDLTGLRGNDLILARRKLPNPKFLP